MLNEKMRLTPAQMNANLALAQQARKERSALLAMVRSGEMPPAMAFNDVRLAKCPVRTLLLACPGIGTAKAWRLMDGCHIAANRRVQGLGNRQRDALLVALDRLGGR